MTFHDSLLCVLYIEDIARWEGDEGDDSDVPDLDELLTAIKARREVKKGKAYITLISSCFGG